MTAVGASAHAQSPGDQADALFQRGKDLMAGGKVAEACAAFDESQRIEPATATVLNQANCREQNDQLATARLLFLEAARQTRDATDEKGKRRHETARTRAARLEPRLSTLRIDVPAARRIDGLEVLRDGAIVATASWNAALPVDGGTYTISARAPGRAAWSETITVAVERDTRVVELPALVEPRAPKPDAIPARPRVVVPSTVQPPGAAPEVGWTPSRKLAVGLGAGGVAALATASALGVLARHRQSDSHALCPDPELACEGADRANELSASAHHLAIGANIGFGVAAGAATAAVVLWMTGAPGSNRGVAIAPAVSPGQFVVTARRSW